MPFSFMACPRKVLGRGKEGTVLCVETKNGPLALKIFDKGSLAQRKAAYRRHLQFLRMYSNTNLVPMLVNFAERDEAPVIAMEMIPGFTPEPTEEVRRQADALTAPNRWSDIARKGNCICSPDPLRPIVFLEGGTMNHPWDT